IWVPKKALPNALGGGALQAINDTKASEAINTNEKTYGPALFYEISFKTRGKYYVYVRGIAPDDDTGGTHDSIHVGLWGETVATSHTDIGLNGIGIGFDKTEFAWVNEYNASGGGRKFETIINIPQPGTYILLLWMRENGVVVDKVV